VNPFDLVPWWVWPLSFFVGVAVGLLRLVVLV
jgi:hypothetical protein